ncbi:ADAM10: Disintegrin and metalloproteinase domain-containing protein 10 [Crotalus adamanteus]|uniref:ADAM10: Disintegrin and metalloproteinase domain-containing protein 10 n=1 Tax=Crotalus adamanteus TaxID=8729 RepID=A0AAW1C5R8_CROAD
MSVFVEDVEIVMKDTSKPVDVSFVYSGTLQGDAASFCHGSIIHGVFEGFVQTQNGTYYIESAAVVKGVPETHSLIHHQRDLGENIEHCKRQAPVPSPGPISFSRSNGVDISFQTEERNRSWNTCANYAPQGSRPPKVAIKL